MLTAKSLEFLEKFMLCSGPSGYEQETAACFRKYISGFCDECYTDVMGNTVGVLNPQADFKVMLAGHYDEIGFQITWIAPEGLLYFRKTGGIDKLTIPGSEVEVLTEKGRLPGVIGKKPIHLLKDKERDQALDLEDLWIDIGAENKEDAETMVRVGDPVTMRSNFARLGKYRVKSKGMDDKVGAFVVAETLRELSKKKLKVGVYGAGTVQEELGLRGATTSAFGINPDIGFAVDVGFTTDLPDISKKVVGDISLGKGPKLTRSADNNEILGKLLRQTAKKYKLPYQENAGTSASGGTDTAAIQVTRSGVATALLGIPNRYMHTSVEICDIRDIEASVSLLVETIAALKGTESFIPGMD